MTERGKSWIGLAAGILITAAAFAAGNQYEPGLKLRPQAGGGSVVERTDAMNGAGGTEGFADGGRSPEAGNGAGETGNPAGGGSAEGENPPGEGGFVPGEGEGEGGEKQDKNLLTVSLSEERLLGGLYEAMESGDLEQTARILNDNPEQLRALADGTMGGNLYLVVPANRAGEKGYRLRPLAAETSGSGLVLTKFNTVFYGEFAGGKPEGHVQAVQAVILDDPRYTFADGQWIQGKMNGAGASGFCYYDEKPEGSYATTRKRGNFRDNLMEGDLIYEADNGNGRVLSWLIKAAAGVTVIDDRWGYYPSSKEYMLMSEEDQDRAYVISESAKDAVRWNNLIIWDE